MRDEMVIIKKLAVENARSRVHAFNTGRQAFVTHVNPTKSQYAAARQVIIMGKKAVEHIRKSPREKVNCYSVLRWSRCARRSQVHNFVRKNVHVRAREKNIRDGGIEGGW